MSERQVYRLSAAEFGRIWALAVNDAGRTGAAEALTLAVLEQATAYVAVRARIDLHLAVADIEGVAVSLHRQVDAGGETFLLAMDDRPPKAEEH